METSTFWNRITEKEPKEENKRDQAAKKINGKQRTTVFQKSLHVNCHTAMN